jgi:hypothetical protein
MLLAQAQALRAEQAEARARAIAARVTMPPTPAPIPIWDPARLGQVDQAPVMPPPDPGPVLDRARARRQVEVDRRAALNAEFATTRPTPNPDEANRMAAGEIVAVKQWDLSEIDRSSPDPFEPPGRPIPPDPPVNTAPPTVALLSGSVFEVGATLLATVGIWSGGPGLTYERSWARGGRLIPGATGISYVLTAPDTGFMLTFAVRCTTAQGGQNLAGAQSVGPVVPASPRARRPGTAPVAQKRPAEALGPAPGVRRPGDAKSQP